MNKSILQFLFCTLFLSFSVSNYAQVTIGSNVPPLPGALLDLKEQNAATEGGVTSIKGFGLPRVELTDLSKLKIGTGPTATEITEAADLLAHTGLLVYNITEAPCASTPIHKGLYVWNGSQWQFLGKQEDPSPDVHYYTDTRAHGGALAGTTQTYSYRNFGSAGDWMLENMRYIPDNALVPANEQMTESLGDDNANSKYYAFPNQTTLGTVPSSWSPNLGLLYTYSAAISGAQDNLNKNQAHEAADEGPATPIQGICPPNWHVPSDREWNELEAYIQNNMADYSTETATQAWNPTWNTANNQSDNLGTAMKSVCHVPTSAFATGGKSFSTNQGGFNVLLAGFANFGKTNFYGKGAFLWSSSSLGSDSAWRRYLDNGNADVLRNYTSRSNLFSVRCKKD